MNTNQNIKSEDAINDANNLLPNLVYGRKLIAFVPFELDF